MSNLAIQVNNLSKRYRIGLKEELHDTFVSSFISWAKSPFSNLRKVRNLTDFSDDGQELDTIWALNDVSLNLQEGEVLGIIGRNGAGKSTLLKILSRIVEPTSGSCIIHGRVASLLEVGTGFHSELSGRENLYLNGAILGMSKREMDSKFEEIVDFSGVGKFIDTPVKRYSSGMSVRLAFSIAAHLDPEILIIDEVLAVGDAYFQKKCLGKMQEVSSQGRTVLFVSHQMNAVQSLCDRCILLENGRITHDGDTEVIINKYLNLSKASENISDFRYAKDKYKDMNFGETLSINEVELKNKNNLIAVGEKLSVNVSVQSNVSYDLNNLRLSIIITDLGGKGLSRSNLKENFEVKRRSKTIINITVNTGFYLMPGTYCVSLHLYKGDLSAKYRMLDMIDNYPQFEVYASKDKNNNENNNYWKSGWSRISFDASMAIIE
tara:strand:+ start:1055 stop:2359 length:1305 start_codon:yes stop_codon:yes gene_type:complete